MANSARYFLQHQWTTNRELFPRSPSTVLKAIPPTTEKISQYNAMLAFKYNLATVQRSITRAPPLVRAGRGGGNSPVGDRCLQSHCLRYRQAKSRTSMNQQTSLQTGKLSSSKVQSLKFEIRTSAGRRLLLPFPLLRCASEGVCAGHLHAPGGSAAFGRRIRASSAGNLGGFHRLRASPGWGACRFAAIRRDTS